MSFDALHKSEDAAPWQLRWKWPQWHRFSDGTDSSRKLQGTLVGHTAARVAVSELLEHLSESESVKESAELMHEENSTTSQSLMLTVSILKSSSEDSFVERHDVADVVIVDIMKQKETSNLKEDSGAYQCLESITLHWPRLVGNRNDPLEEAKSRHRVAGPCAVLFGNANPLFQLLGWVKPISERSALQLLPETEDDVMEHSNDCSEISCFSGHGRPQTRTSTSKGIFSSGISAVTFVRLPKKETVASTSDADVLDILKLMSLDRGSYDEAIATESSLDQEVQTEMEGSANNAETTEKTAAVPLELFLVCLTNDGKLLFYSPWRLLNTPRDARNKSNQDGMSSFWFGIQMLNEVKKTVLPLSEPEHVVSLSISFLRRGENPDDQPWNEAAVTAPTSQLTVSKDSNADDVSPVLPSVKVPLHLKSSAPTKQPFLAAVFNASAWDPTLDPSSLCYQTLDNVPTHCVAVHDYVCIAGRGRRRWKGVKNGSDKGGFVTFVSMRTKSEKRTLFLPFAPTHLSPLNWAEMSLLFVSGQGHAAVIRTDGSSTVQATPLVYENSSKKSECAVDNPSAVTSKKNPSVLVQRFQILPIDVSTVNRSVVKNFTVIGCGIATSPPVVAIVFTDASSSEGIYVSKKTLFSLDIVSRRNEDLAIFSEYLNNQETSVIVTTTAPNAMPPAWVPISCPDLKDIWCRLGQGWCAIGSGGKSYVICYEGSNSVRRAYVEDVNVNGDETIAFANCVECSILDIDPFAKSNVAADRRDVSSLFTQPALTRMRAAELTVSERSTDRTDTVENIDDILLDAMESISSLNYRGSFGSNSPPGSRRNRPSSFTTREKSQRLLRHCSSWTKLDQSSSSHSLFECQSPVVNLRTRTNDLAVLTFRSEALQCGSQAPFQKVLSWLSEQEDFFTASSLAFDLLRDVESLRHLWRAFDKIENEHELSKLDGLLDGITPLNLDETDSEDVRTSQTVVQLADMTVACLIKGGFAMSSTLEQFLGRNVLYDPSRASLMLVAAAAGTFSDDESHVSSVMGPGYSRGPNHLGCILWPIRSLLKIGAARDCLGTVLLLLNTTIPDELRRRDRLGVPLTTTSSLDLCKEVVKLILSASSDGSEMLLDLVDERSRLRFWDSMEHETKLELSVIELSGSYGLLRDQEVRSWVLVELQKCIESEDLATVANIYDVSPTRWLQTLVWGCLQNAGCNIPSLLNPNHGETKEDVCNDGDLVRYRDAIKNARVALRPAPNSGGLDSDILIPALLLLEHRNVEWQSSSETSTRTVLNAVCYHAGRCTEEVPLFPMNSDRLMRQCTRLGDVEAGANLVGGKSGLILLCCLSLIDEAGISMDDAERFVLGDLTIVRDVASSTRNGFSIQECHLRLLWLLEEHVLKIRAYGEFTELRGKVDPVFAATAVFRTWWALTKDPVILSDATKWLVNWLRQQLRMPFDDKTMTSPNRLVCAALIQSLAWPQHNDSSPVSLDKNVPLANMLEMDEIFLLQLAHSCCGMVEALPLYITDASSGSWSDLDLAFTLPSPSKRNASSVSSVGDLSLSPARTNTVEESFLSAAGSYRDLDTSQISWYSK